MDLLQFTPIGIYCPPADVYLDPSRGVARAIISHAHSDHARGGSKYYLAHADSDALLRVRLGKKIPLETLPYGKTISINGVQFSFHPAGHILGSAQIRVEHRGEVWVYTGDYKLEADGLSPPFEPVHCHTLITESTFGLPIYRWKPQAELFREMAFWWEMNAQQGICSVMTAYSLGKAQRILVNLPRDIGPIYVHPAIYEMHEAIRHAGFALPQDQNAGTQPPTRDLHRALVIAPPMGMADAWMRALEPYALGVASGWVSVRNKRKRMAADRGFGLSDHADWDGLNAAVQASGAERIIVTHGFTEVYSKWLRERGWNAEAAKIPSRRSAEAIDED